MQVIRSMPFPVNIQRSAQQSKTALMPLQLQLEHMHTQATIGNLNSMS